MGQAIPGGAGWQMDGDTLSGEITDLDAFLAAHADDRCVHVLAALFQGDTAGARDALAPLLAETPDNWRLLALEADIWRDEGQVADAIERYRALLAAGVVPSRRATLTQHLGKVHFVAGNYAEAASCFERALQLRVENGAAEDLIESSRAALARASHARRRSTS